MILKKDKINELLEKIIFFYNTPFDNLMSLSNNSIF